MNAQAKVWKLTRWIFGFVVLAVGLLNTFWGNDPGFGVFLMLLSIIYFLLVNTWLRNKTNYSVPAILKILLGILIIRAALGVGELFGKINLMMQGL